MEDEIYLSTDQVSSGNFLDTILNLDLTFLQIWLVRVGENPFATMWYAFVYGGWVILLFLFYKAVTTLWLVRVQSIAAKKKKFILLAIDVPRLSEQTVKAVENMFAHMAGAHSPVGSWSEKWLEGKTQDPISFEIISIEGHVQYLIRCLDKLRDLVEASVYAQYPEAEITQVEDYAQAVPSEYPDDTYECFGTEMTNVTNDVYPLKSYLDFEHGLTGEYKDPLAVMLEAFSRLGPGEQAWYQIIYIPIDQKEYKKKAQAEILNLKGEKPKVKKNIVEQALDLPIQGMGVAGDVLFGADGASEKKKEEKPMSKMMTLTPGERGTIEAIERKMGKIQGQCKIRFLYIAKKEVFSKAKILQSFVGSIKQFNTNDLQALKPEGKKVGVNGTLIWFKNKRNNRRKEKLVSAYRSRSGWMGLEPFHLGTDELASLWHLPVVLNVKAPQLKKTEAKKVEPPINLPFA
ncbi:hypothetical protein GF380_04510 [Candidatus Uhrbacteria bacterium]|nr:hypothetical protein [Candidatus Uhrbacteria bacterium]MBD3284322.1 hypothetical protein [Candidatus Uhrbacteria bacterium]